jgi:hypothetical protein
MPPIAQGTRGNGRGHVERKDGRTGISGPWVRTKVPKCVLELVEELYEILIHDYCFSILFVLSWELKMCEWDEVDGHGQ